MADTHAHKKDAHASPNISTETHTTDVLKQHRRRRHLKLPDDLYETTKAHFLASYRNPLEEEITWKKPAVHIPLVWWILFILTTVSSVAVFSILFLFPELVDIPHMHSISRPLLTTMVCIIVFVGLTLNVVFLKKPPFWNKFHTLYAFTGFFWGFGGVAGISSLVVTSWIDWTFISLNVNEFISLILPISLWAGGIIIIPPVVASWLLPAWERHAPLIRLGMIHVFWGVYAGVILTLVAPYISRDNPELAFIVIALAAFPAAGTFTAGIVVSLPIRFPVSFTAFLNYIIGIVFVGVGVATILSFALIGNTPLAVTITLTIMMLVLTGVGLWALFTVSRAPDPLLRDNLAHLQTWVDVDVISPDEYEFMCSESIISEWIHEALRRGVFLAARDYYRAVMQLAFLDYNDDSTQVLASTVTATRRKLEAAGIPPRVNYKQFANAPIFPHILG